MQFFLFRVLAVVGHGGFTTVLILRPRWPATEQVSTLRPEIGEKRKNVIMLYYSCEPACPLQRSLGPFGPEMPKKSLKCLPGPPTPEPREVSKKSREQSGKSPESLRKVSKESFQTVPGTFPGKHFRDFKFWAFRARRREGHERPL